MFRMAAILSGVYARWAMVFSFSFHFYFLLERWNFRFAYFYWKISSLTKLSYLQGNASGGIRAKNSGQLVHLTIDAAWNFISNTSVLPDQLPSCMYI